MKVRLRRVISCAFILIMTVLFSVLAAGCSGPAGAPQEQQENAADPGAEQEFAIYNIGTADSGGSMYAASTAIAAAVMMRDERIRFNIIASTGSRHNIDGLMQGELDLALVSGDTAAAAVRGRGRFEGKPAEKLRAICAVYPSISSWMVLSSSRLNYVSDLRGGKAAIGPEDSATEAAAKTALAAVGLDPEDPGFVNAGLGSGADMVASWNVDAVHAFAGIPVPGLSRLAEQHSCRFLQYRPEQLDRILELEPAYFRAVIPAGTYEGQTDPVETFGAKCLLCVSADMPEETAYHFAELLCGALPELSEGEGLLSHMRDDSFLLEELPVELHPGAAKYFRDRKIKGEQP